MAKKVKCPMMCGMPMLPQMAPMYMEPDMPMLEDTEMENYYEDEEDDRLLMGMYPDICKKIMIYVKVEIDRMEEKDETIHDVRPDRTMVDMMTDNAYRRMVKEMPDMAEEDAARQFPGRRYSRDLLRLLLLNELFRRRRRRRRRIPYGYPFGDFDFDNDYYDYD